MEDKQEQHGGGEEPPGSTEHKVAPSPEEAKPEDASGEKEEEEAFLVSLYKFMKERHTPIERIPHLGFKQINLWKIYKAVEKLGAYELVTGRRLWKNVYDELGGSPGSTSAATCTRRHYERLVLPYVRHLKGEDDKPLPPSKPRKQYKVSKGSEMGEKSRRSKKEKGREQVAPEKAKPEVAATPTASKDSTEPQEQGQPAEGCTSPTAPAPSPSAGCPSTCRAHSEAYKRLFSSFYSKGNHPIMSPLAKKKLLSQVSKAESLHCLKRHCLEDRGVLSSAQPNPEPSPAVSPQLKEQRSPETQGLKDTPQGARSEAGPVPSSSPGGTDRQPYPRAEDGGPAPAVFTGFFHAYRNEVLKPIGCHPFGGYFSNLKDFLEPQPEDTGQEQPQDLRSKAWSRESPQPAAFAAIKACWVPPGAGFTPLTQSPTAPAAKRSRDEEPLGPSRKLQVVSPFLHESECRDKGAGSPRGHQGLAKPKAIIPGPGYAAPLPAVPQAPDVYKGAMLRFPVNFNNPLEHLKNQAAPAAPSLSINPFVIPAFPSPVIATSVQPSDLRHYPASYEGSMHHRLYPATWHTYSTPHSSAFHRNTKL